MRKAFHKKGNQGKAVYRFCGNGPCENLLDVDLKRDYCSDACQAEQEEWENQD